MELLVSRNEGVNRIAVVKCSSCSPWAKNIKWQLQQLTKHLMSGSPSGSHIENQHERSTATAWSLASSKLHELNLTSPALTTLGAWTDSPHNLPKLIEIICSPICERMCNTYSFDCRKHTVRCNRISFWGQICHDLFRITVSYCVIVVFTCETSGNIILIIATACSCLLAFSLRYCTNPF